MLQSALVVSHEHREGVLENAWSDNWYNDTFKNLTELESDHIMLEKGASEFENHKCTSENENPELENAGREGENRNDELENMIRELENGA